jgi:Transposase
LSVTCRGEIDAVNAACCVRRGGDWKRGTSSGLPARQSSTLPMSTRFGSNLVEPQPPTRKLLYRRGGLSHPLSQGISHDFRPAIPPAREGRRRKFSEADKRQILEDAALPGARLAEIARRYGIAERVLF